MTQRLVNRCACALVALIAYWITMFTLTHIPMEGVQTFNASDKLLHITAYAVLGTLLGICLHFWGWKSLPIWLMITVTVAVYGAIDETTQPWFGRQMDFKDWVCDLIGGQAGFVMFVVSRSAYRFARRVIPKQTVSFQPETT